MGVDEKKLLQEHIKKQLDNRYTPEDIRRALIDVGFDRNNIDAAFLSLKPAIKLAEKKEPFFAKIFAQKKEEIKPAKAAEKKPEQSVKKEPFFAKIFASKQQEKAIKPAEKKQAIQKQEPVKIHAKTIESQINLKPFLLHIFIAFFILCIGATIVFAPASCVTKESFLEKANGCERATYQNSIAGVSVNYESRNDCKIIKTVERIPGTESDEMKEKLEGKSMACVYYKGDFSPMHIETLAGLIVNCEGPLKQELIKYVT